MLRPLLRGGGGLKAAPRADFRDLWPLKRLFSRHLAFTLAEVLIVIGIIGIIADMTIPTLVHDTQKAVLKSQIKKAWSNYNQVLYQLSFEYSGDTGCYYNPDTKIYDISNCTEFYQEFAKKLRYVKKCDGNALAGGCIPVYSDYRTDESPFNEENLNNNDTVYVLSDGSLLIFVNINFIDEDSSTLYHFAFDVNGVKKPNKPGYDLFAVRVEQNSQGKYYLTNNLNCYLTLIEGRLKYYSDIDSW